MTTSLSGCTGRLISKDSNLEMFFRENTLRIDAFNKKVSSIVETVLEKVGKEGDKKVAWEEVMELSKEELPKFVPLKEENTATLKPLLLANVTSIFHKKQKSMV